MTYTFTITDWHPVILNKLLRMHWAARNRAVDDAKRRVQVACNAKIPKATGKRRLTLTWVMGPRNKEPDRDNVSKLLLDSLVWCGRLTDDDSSGVECLPVRFERGPVKGIVVDLEDV